MLTNQNRKKQPLGASSNIFAVASSSAQRQDHKHYKSLYTYNPNDLAEYALPVLSDTKKLLGKKAPKAQKLEPIPGTDEMAEDMYGMEMDNEQMDNQAEDEYGDEQEAMEQNKHATEDDFSYDEFKQMIEYQEEGNKNDLTEQRRANFIKKGTAIWHIHQGIETGEHAISFFAKHGNNMPIKFVNCNRREVRASEFRPYDLVTEHNDKKLKDEYYTISAQGVVQVFQSATERGQDLSNRTPTEFLSLSEWMSQSTMFNVLTSMKFFKHYLIGKVFRLWKGNVRYRTYNQTRMNLAKNLIQLRPDFCPKFMEINKILFEMQSKLTFDQTMGNKNIFDLSEFEESQSTHRTQQKIHYNEKVEEIINKNLIVLVKEIDQSRSLKEEEDLESTKMGQAAKHKSMVLMKEEKLLKNQVLKLARRNYHSLGTFIRLIDYMVVEAQVRINQESAEQIFGEMTKTENLAKKTQITTQINFQPKDEMAVESGINFSPDKAQFVQTFTKLLFEMKTVFDDTKNEVQRVITHNDLLPLVTGLITESGPKFNTIVDDSFRYNTTQKDILTRLEEDFSELEEKSQEWRGAMPMQYEKDTFNEVEFKAENISVGPIRDKLQQYVEWQDQLQKKFKQTEVRGMINMDARQMKNNLEKFLKETHISLRVHAFEQGEKINKNLNREFETLQEKLKGDFQKLDEFVNFVKDLNKAVAQVDELDHMKLNLEHFRQLLSMGKLKVKEESHGDYVSSKQNYHVQRISSFLEQFDTNKDRLLKQIEDARKKTDESKAQYVEALKDSMGKLEQDVETQVMELQQDDLLNDATDKQEALKQLERIKTKFDKAKRQIDVYHDYETVLAQEKKEMLIVDTFEEKYMVRHTLWSMRQDFSVFKNKWLHENFKEQDAEQIEQTTKKFWNRFTQLKMNKFKQDERDDVLDKLESEIMDIKSKMKLIQALGNKSMQQKHWDKVFKLLNIAKMGNLNQPVMLNYLITDGNALSEIEEIEAISASASGEKTIKDTMAQVKERWEKTDFTVVNYRDTKDRFIIRQVEDVITQLEDDQMVVSTCMGSKFVTEIRDEVEKWEKSLGYLGYLIEDWLNFQRQWMYLENIFNAADIQAQLKNETKKFQTVDKFWKDWMLKVKKEPKVTSFDDYITGSNHKKFIDNNAKLEEVTKALEDYLETKRAAFPRFYFLTNDELLEILSQTRNPQAVQPHLGKCFDAIKKIEFEKSKGSTEILGMWSPEGEYVPFSTSQFAQGAVEDWLGRIEKQMNQCLYDITKKAFNKYPLDGTKRDEWLFDYPAQPVLTIDMVKWTSGVDHAIEEIQSGRETTALQSFMEFSDKQLSAMIRLVRGPLKPLQRQMMGALIVLDVHNKTTVKNMMDAKVDKTDHFDWQKQLRYYWEPLRDMDGDPYKGDDTSHDCFCKQTNTRFRYGYEYLGNNARLVITPLTDKCYMTLTGALHLNFGGNPQGPAGTGKTETTKDLAKAMAIQCIVFNCSDGLDAKMMARFFVGLASGGAWSCFDEFNRINIEVLSVIGTQILTIQTAVRERKSVFDFEGNTAVPLNLRFGVFITMNPGYAGRTELPDNLKALFRPISMMIPDYGLIAQIILYSEGFGKAEKLAKKMVKLYSLSSEQLSKQDHYDFGMRAVKSVLVMAGQLKRKDVEGKEDEDILLIRAMRDSNVPKFLSQDLPLFQGIITDLFPGIVIPMIDYGLVEKSIRSVLRSEKKQEVKSFITKIIQLLETMQVRHGNMVVGTTGTGKSTVTHTLEKALTKLYNEGQRHDPWYKPVHVDTLNPKAVTMGELFGEVNKFTNEWTEGIVSRLVKDAVEAMDDETQAHKKRWILFDGPVDALWIENMNTVLDDNKMLCLSSGQRIKMPETCTMLFEVNDLKVASPATVSRCGMVYMEPVHLGWQPLIDTWYEEMKQEVIEPGSAVAEKPAAVTQAKEKPYIIEPFLTEIKEFVTEIITKMLKVVREKCKEVIPSVDSNLVMNCLRFISIFLNNEAIRLNETEKVPNPKKAIMTYIVFSVIWSLGANIQERSRGFFMESLRGELQKKFSEFSHEKDDLYELGLNQETHELRKWDEMIPDFKYNPNVEFFDILVPTSDTVKYKTVLNILMSNGRNALIMGETGVGKSVVTKDFLYNVDEEKYVYTFINFSGKTSSKNLQDAFEGNLEHKRKNLLAPKKAGKTMIFFIDDVNMPQLDRYFSQPPCELLRQTIDSGGFYDIKRLILKQVANCQFVTACAPPSGGRNPVTPRLFRHFNMLWVPELSHLSMKTIFKAILFGYLSHKSEGVSMYSDSIIKTAVEVYNKTKDEFLPTPTKSHYTFNLRDMSKVVQGMTMCPVELIGTEKDYLIMLFMHETQRVFRDRLIDDEDKNRFNERFNEILSKEGLLLEGESGEIKEDILFGFMNDDHKGKYAKLKEESELIKYLNGNLAMYNADNTEMNLVFFLDCIQHLTRISRILKQPRGNALLVGVGGSGRRSMAKFAAFVNGNMQTFTIEIKKNYKLSDFQESIKDLLKKCVLNDDDQQQFLFSDNQIINEGFLEDINNLLNTGEIPNLFPKDEKEALCDEITDKAKAVGMDGSRDQIYSFFVNKCREKLHIVLTFSPVGSKFRERVRQFPSIINCCTIDWYLPWPQDALFAVASREFIAVQDELQIKDLITVLANACCNMHSTVKVTSERYYEELRRRTYTTPTSYLDLVKTFKDLLRKYQDVIPRQISKYERGLTRIDETKITVEKLSQELEAMMPQIEKSQKETQESVKELEEKQAVATEKEKQTDVEAKQAKKVKDQVQGIKDECKRELDKAMPALHKAIESLDTLKPADIGEMKGYASPPEDLVLLLQSVMFILDVKGAWPEAVQLMKDPKGFIEQLKNFDKDGMKEKKLNGLKKFVKDPRLVPKAIAKKSKAGESIAMWVHAMDTYGEVKKIVVPKEAKLKEAEAELAVVQKELDEKMKTLNIIRKEIQRLQSNYKEQQMQLDKLETTRDNNQQMLSRAEKLLSGLENESQRWQDSIVQLKKDKENMTGNIVLAAGYVSYLGCYTAKYRAELLQNWQKFLNTNNIKNDLNFTVRQTLGNPISIRDWNIKGLPKDDLSIENGIISTNATRWPLLIDPQSQGNKWIKQMERENNLQIIKLTEGNFIKKVENAIRQGLPLMCENILEEIDPQLEPVLAKEIFKSQGSDCIKLGGENIIYHKDFKFIITTKLPNPHYLPEICIMVTLINFTVTPDGLEDQLLVAVVNNECPELEEQNDKLIVQLADFQRNLKDIEDKILKLVADAGEDILKDDELINVLDASKQTSKTINEQLEQAQRVQEKIEEDREKYRGVARRGSVLYFVIADLATINFMYQYSLEFFLTLFTNRLRLSKKSDDIEERLKIMTDDITQSTYTNICRGLFEADKLMYSFLNTANILRRDGLISVDEWNFFLRGTTTDFSKVVRPEKIDYIEDQIYHGLLGLEETHRSFREITKSFQDPADKLTWKDIMKSENPEKIPLPALWAENLTKFQQLMVIKVLRKTKLIYSVKQFIKETLGRYFIESPPMKLKEVLMDSTNVTPIIFVLSPGADPIAYLMQLAREENMIDKLRTISLGQGQDKIASKLIDEGSKTGLWVCFQNCHLFTSWMGEFEKIQERQDKSLMHADYRLWLTSDPSNSFPVPILQSGIKITQEPPRGLKANMNNTFRDIGRKRYEEECDKGKEYRKLVFALAYFHSAILERRKYGAIGWNVSYQWMNSDFNCSEQQLMMYLNEQPEVPYQALNYLVALVNYGGRVTDDKDVRLIEAMLKKYFTAEIMGDNYKLSKLPFYYAPPDGSYDACVAYINQLPLDEDPEVFGLHPNANITYENNTVNFFIDCILLVQPRVKGKGNQQSPEQIVAAKAREMFTRLPSTLDTKKANDQTLQRDKEGNIINSLGVFCNQEVERFNRLLTVIKKQLEDLEKAIAGTVVMSQDLENIMICIQNNKTPETWLSTSLGYPCLKPVASWFEDFLKRLDFMKDWLANGPPLSYWISCFFFPQGFMTATLQTYARKTQTPIDTLAFRTNVLPLQIADLNEEAKPEIGVNIHGMFMQGAKWSYEKKCVDDSDPKQPMISFPVIWLEPIEDKEYTLDKRYQCPLYKTSIRAGELSTTGHSTNFVLYMDLPIDGSQVQNSDYWIRRGTALLCMTDD